VELWLTTVYLSIINIVCGLRKAAGCSAYNTCSTQTRYLQSYNSVVMVFNYNMHSKLLVQAHPTVQFAST